ncbi:MAG: four helix bundle protein [Candidatus Uhrbacteria bacterium]|nr:four helix bundle protein [Candidatus Uhrbacteria bacterium]
MAAGDYRELIVWKKSMDFVEKLYKATRSFPREEMYGLSSQMRRAAVSIPSNIAEGKRRMSGPELRRFLLIAFGSGAELETQLEIARRVGYLSLEDERVLGTDLSEIMRMLNALIGSSR